MPAQSVEIPVFDPSAVEKIRNVAGDQGSVFVAEMAELFLVETAKSMQDLRAAGERAEWKTVARVCHSLKSSAATLGLMQLANACRTLELDTKSATSSPETQGLLAAVFDQFERAVPILKSLV